MELLTVIIVLLALISKTVSGADVSEKLRPVISLRDTASQPEPNWHVLGNLSHLFGWQMAGAAISEDEAFATCSEASSANAVKWAAMGLTPESILDPSCNSTNSNPDPKDSISPIITYTSAIFITQLLGSFNDSALLYMCNKVDFFMIDNFLLNDGIILGGICNHVGKQLPPRPFTPAGDGTLGLAAGVAAKNSATVLYAFMLSSGATTSADLVLMCANAPSHMANLKAEFLNATVYQETLCSIESVMSVGEAVEGMVTWLTRNFITMVENISVVDGWLTWLCNTADVDLMNSVNLDGIAAVHQICQDSETDTSS